MLKSLHRRPAIAPGRCEGPPWSPPGTRPASVGRRGSCPSGRRSCPLASGECSHPLTLVADPAHNAG